jgi:hypothetical protein
VVPFESHQVEQRVRSAVFASALADAQTQVEQLPEPKGNYNTALYTAVMTALGVLEEQKARDPEAQVILVVLTDGQNQILRGDDSGLLDGPEGLSAVLLKLRQVGIQVLTVGFGDPSIAQGKKGAIDVAALQQVAWPSAKNFHTAEDAQNLGRIFGVARKLLVDRLQVTFATDDADRGQLAGQDLRFQVRFRLSESRILESPSISLNTPQVAAPPFEGALDIGEKRTLAEISAADSSALAQSTETAVLRRLLILSALGAILAFFWFVPPILLWSSKSQPARSKNDLVPEEPSSRAVAATIVPHAKPEETIIPLQQATLFPPLRSIQQTPPSPDQTIIDPRGMETVLEEKPRDWPKAKGGSKS